MLYRPLQILHTQNGHAQNHQHYAGGAVEGGWFGLIGKLGRDARPQQGAEHTAYQAEQVRRTANGKVADRTRQGRKGHDKHAGARGGLQLRTPAPR